MKALNSSEKFFLIRKHGEALALVMHGAPMTKRSDVIEAAQRVIDLAKSIPKAEWGLE